MLKSRTRRATEVAVAALLLLLLAISAFTIPVSLFAIALKAFGLQLTEPSWVQLVLALFGPPVAAAYVFCIGKSYEEW